MLDGARRCSTVLDSARRVSLEWQEAVVKSGEEAAAGGLWVIMYGRSTPAPAGSPSTLDSWLAEPEPRRTGVAKQCTAARHSWLGAAGSERGIGLFFWLKAWRCALHQTLAPDLAPALAASRSPRTHSQLWLCWFRGCGRRRQAAAASQLELCSYPVVHNRRRGCVHVWMCGCVQAKQTLRLFFFSFFFSFAPTATSDQPAQSGAPWQLARLQSCCRAGLPFSQRAGCEGTE